jgi:hypothetical protein
MTTPDTIVVGSHQWSVADRARSTVAFVGGVGALVASNLLHERWLTWVGVTLIVAFAYVAVTSGRVVRMTPDRLEVVGLFGIRSIEARDLIEVSAADDPYGSVIAVFRPKRGRPQSIPMAVIEQHPQGLIALHQYIDTAIGSGQLDPRRVSLKNELAFY